MREGIDHPTGAAAARPPSETLIQNVAHAGIGGSGGAHDGKAQEHAGHKTAFATMSRRPRGR